MLEGPNGSVYLTDLENSAIVRWDPANKRVEQISRGQTSTLARHIKLGTERRDVRDRIADQKNAAVQQRQIHAQRACTSFGRSLEIKRE